MSRPGQLFQGSNSALGTLVCLEVTLVQHCVTQAHFEATRVEHYVTLVQHYATFIEYQVTLPGCDFGPRK